MGLGEEKEANVTYALSPEHHVKMVPVLNSRWVHRCLLYYSPQFYGVCLTLQSRKRKRDEKGFDDKVQSIHQGTWSTS